MDIETQNKLLNDRMEDRILEIEEEIKLLDLSLGTDQLRELIREKDHLLFKLGRDKGWKI